MDFTTQLLTDISQQTLVTWTADCAARTLPAYEAAYPSDLRPRRAIEAARAWVANPTAETADAAYGAARAAWAAADAARRAAYAIACAAYAAGVAAGAAAYAARAARAAYAAAVGAANEAARAAIDMQAEQRWQLTHLGQLLGFTLTEAELEIVEGLATGWETTLVDLLTASQAVLA